MTKIDNLTQAKETVDALSDFLRRFEQTLDALGSLTGQASTASIPHRGSLAPPRRTPPPNGVPGRPMPDAMPERIFAILKSTGRAMTVSEMVEQHRQFGWALPDRKALYKQMLASAYYMATKKGTLVNNNGKYTIAPYEATHG
jgi:hypothetical protein